jgi:hypothetical protein
MIKSRRLRLEGDVAGRREMDGLLFMPSPCITVFPSNFNFRADSSSEYRG